MKETATRVSIVIPHYNGEELLRRCLHAVQETVYPAYDIIVVDNGSDDGSRTMVRETFPDIKLIEIPVNVGFAAGCNLGIQSSDTPFVVLLNNDTVVDPGWLAPLIESMESNPECGAVQSKLLSLQSPDRFDYAGAAGGEMDLFGYPFAWGRIFGSVEDDTGQYDRRKPVFWASGAAVALRRSALDHVGLLDEAFFAHFEEIDLAWRLHWAGYRVWVDPRSVVFHQTASTLSSGRIKKMVLNHRNSMLVLLKNYPAAGLCIIVPFRLILEGVTIFASLFTGRPKRAVAVLLGFVGLVRRWSTVVDGRRRIKHIRKVSDRTVLANLYRGSIVMDYYMKGIRSTSRWIRQDEKLCSGMTGHKTNTTETN